MATVATPPTPSTADLTAIAQSYSLPPAILQGIIAGAAGQPGLGLPTATLSAFGLSATDLKSNPLLAMEVAARVLFQAFSRYGSWESALSDYLTGDPTAYQSPTSPVGGQVYSILGAAAANPTFGMQGYQPANGVSFAMASDGFLRELQQMEQMGGAVSAQTVRSYSTTAATYAVSAFSIPYRPNPQLGQYMVDVLDAINQVRQQKNQPQIPVTAANVAVLQTMARGEGMPGWTNNPLASTQGQGGTFNSVGVKEYGSYQQGVAMTADTLMNGYYDGLLGAMAKGQDLATMARDPSVQSALRTWQGGSNEDVNLLLGAGNVAATPVGGAGTPSTAAPATPPPTQPAQPQKTPDPAAVGSFAAQLQAAGINPQTFAEYFPVLAQERRRLLGSKSTTVSDFVGMYQALEAQGTAVSNDAITGYLSAQPHPQYPSITTGAFQKTLAQATLHSMLHTNQVPTSSEVAQMAQGDWGYREMSDYYQKKQAWLAASPAKPATAAGPATRGGAYAQSKVAGAPAQPAQPAAAGPRLPGIRGGLRAA
jgi:hypothetical protein